jgi:hypothetical protein
MLAKRRKNESYQLLQDEDLQVSSSSDDKDEIDAKQLKFFKDLEDIKAKRD